MYIQTKEVSHMSYAKPEYKKTVRCGYCGIAGHNRTTCIVLDKRMEKLRAENGPDHWAVSEYYAKKEKKVSSNKSRKCSYCLEVGHNRTTCLILNVHMHDTVQDNITYRKAIFNRMVHHHLSVGALVTTGSFQKYGAQQQSARFLTPWVVTKVCWDNINLWETEFRAFSTDIKSRHPLEVRRLSSFTAEPNYLNAKEVNFPYDYEMNFNKLTIKLFSRYDDESHWYNGYKASYFITVISGVDAQKPPIGWLRCEDKNFQKSLKELYKTRKSNMGPYRRDFE
mgnify:CR=1 FL=1